MRVRPRWDERVRPWQKVVCGLGIMREMEMRGKGGEIEEGFRRVHSFDSWAV